MNSKALRDELEPLPRHMRGLPVHRGYPVPYFVEWVVRDADGEIKGVPPGQGEPDFRVMSHHRLVRCLTDARCWVCGGKLGTFKSFTIGPMCAINRTSAEPPGHLSCAEWSARNCPFLTRPHARRRGLGDLETVEAPGIMLARNPGVAAVWTTRRYKPFRCENGLLFDIGEPESVSFWAEGRPATREEVEASIDSGLPLLKEIAEAESEAALAELHACVTRAKALLPVAA